MKVFSAEWASAFHDAIKTNEAYATSGAKWELGKLALLLDDEAVLLDLFRGDCRSVESVSAQEATTLANFIIEGNIATWQDVLSGKLQPLMGIMSGKLKLRKGSIGKLLPFTKAAVDLVNSAQSVETEF